MYEKDLVLNKQQALIRIKMQPTDHLMIFLVNTLLFLKT